MLIYIYDKDKLTIYEKYYSIFLNKKTINYDIVEDDTLSIKTIYYKQNEIIDSIVSIKNKYSENENQKPNYVYFTYKEIENFATNKIEFINTYSKNLKYNYKKADENGNLIYKLNYWGFINNGSSCNRKYSDTSSASITKYYYDKLNRQTGHEIFNYEICPNQAQWLLTSIYTSTILYKKNGLIHKEINQGYKVKKHKIIRISHQSKKHKYWYYK